MQHFFPIRLKSSLGENPLFWKKNVPYQIILKFKKTDTGPHPSTEKKLPSIS